MKGKTELLEQTGDGADLVAQLEQKLSEIEVSSGVTESEGYVGIVDFLLLCKKKTHYLTTFLTRTKSRKLKSKEIFYNWRWNDSVVTWQ